MGAYILRRLALMIPTIIGIMGISFLVIQFAPGGPVEQLIAQLRHTAVSATARVGGGEGVEAGRGGAAQGGRGPLSPAGGRGRGAGWWLGRR